MLDLFAITQAQLGECNSLLGIMLFLTYIPSGWLADRVNPNRLLAVSMAGTGVLALTLATAPAFFYIKLIFVALGLTTGLTLWASLIRTTSLIAPHDQQGKFFGALESGRGIVEALLASIALAFFAFTIEQQSFTTATAISRVLTFYGLVAFGLSPLIFARLRSPDVPLTNLSTPSTYSSTWLEFKTLLMNPSIWLSTVIILSGYQIFWVTYSFSGLLESVFELGAVTVATITVARLWMRPISPIIAGLIGDRFHAVRFLAVLLLIAAVTMATLPLLPTTASVTSLFIVILAISLVTFGIRGIYWATLDDCNVRTSTRGMAVGFISLIAYAPDIYVPLVQSWSLSLWPGKAGYAIYYAIFSAFGIVGCIAALKLASLSERTHDT